MSNVLTQPLVKHLFHSLILTGNELKRNIFAWLAPLPLLLGIVWLSSNRGWQPIILNSTGNWLYLLAGIIFIMVYGLQAFSSEADRKTLDFLITKPLSSYSIIFAKYLVGQFIFWGWWHAFNLFLKPEIALLGLPKGIGVEWIVLVLLIVHAVSFLSGLMSKGLERFFVITVTTALISSGAYYLWHKLFRLITVNFLWFDIPPQLLLFIQKIFPYYLAVLGLAVPLIGVIWYLKSKTRLWQFKPAQGLIGIWLLTLLIIEFIGYLFNPPIWPDRNAESGDWHPKAGIVLTGAAARSEQSVTLSYMSFNRLGRKPHYTYHGTVLKNPRFSPDGKQVAFSENGRIKIINLTRKKIDYLCEGDIAAWSEDGMKLIVGKKISPKGLSLLYLVNLKNNTKHPLISQQVDVVDLVWDSTGKRLYLLSFTGQLNSLNLKDNSIKELQFPENDKPKHFGIIKPNIRFQKEDRLIFIGQVFARTIKVYILNLENESIILSEEKSDFRFLTNGPLIFNQEGTAYLWPRIDGGFGYQGTYYDRHHDHEHEHHE